jgi:tight adherence protein B
VTAALWFIKLGAVSACALAALFATWASVRDAQAAPYRYFELYVAYLERKLRSMFIGTRGKHIAFTQLGACAAILALALALHDFSLCFFLLPCLLGPALVIERQRRLRVRAIEAKVDAFALALANALKATPSIGNAIAYTQPLLPPPLDAEVLLALKEMRLGHTVEQALLSMAGRVRSQQLDAALAGLLVGQKVGGDLPKILERTAATLREMARLDGVVRAKTAESKAQLGVLAVFPIVIVLLFDTVSRGYFDPLAQSVAGWFVLATSVGLWIASLAAARKVLDVDL